MRLEQRKNKRLVIFAIFMIFAVNVHSVSASSKTEPLQTYAVKAKVDQRIELMSIIARLAGYQEYVNNNIKQYAADVDKHFEKYKQHPAVQYAVKIRKSNSIGFDAVMFMAVHLNPPPALTPRIAFSDQVPESRWGKKTAEEFAKLLLEFYKDADCESFFRAHADLYSAAEERFQKVLDKVDLDWFKRFYGEAPRGDFNLVIGLLIGSGNFGPKVVFPDGKEDLYAIIGSYQTDGDGKPIYDDRLLSTIIHEYNHSFINHLVYDRERQLSDAGEKIYKPVAESMKRLAYGNWITAIHESLVRAAVIRYEFEHEKDKQSQKTNESIIAQRNFGFIWMDELYALLGAYENSRAAYPTFRSFMPLVEGYYNDLAKRIDYKAERFEELKPRVISMSPFANGTENADPAVTLLTFTFDRSLAPKGYSLNYGPRGEEHSPVEKVVGYNENGTAFTVQVKLKPDWEYEFVLTGRGFRTSDGYPLQTYTVKFKTKKL